MNGGICVVDYMVRDKVGVGVDRGRIMPVELWPDESSVELGCLAWEANCGAGLVNDEEFDCKRPQVWCYSC